MLLKNCFTFKRTLGCWAIGQRKSRFKRVSEGLIATSFFPRKPGPTRTLKKAAEACLSRCGEKHPNSKSMQISRGRRNKKIWVCRCYKSYKLGRSDVVKQKKKLSMIGRAMKCPEGKCGCLELNADSLIMLQNIYH